MAKQQKYSAAEYRALVNGPLPAREPSIALRVCATRIGHHGAKLSDTGTNMVMTAAGPAPKVKQTNGFGIARKTEYNGKVYDSKLEATHAQRLDWQFQYGQIKGVQCQVFYKLEVNGKKVTTYRADFLITNLDGSQEIHECKGFAPRSWPMRKKLFEALHPTIKIIVITK